MILGSNLVHNAGEGADEGFGVLTQWTWNDPTLLIPVILGVVYAHGLRNWPQPRRFSKWRPYSFYTGLSFLALALASPIDVLSDDLFFMHMIQHLILVMVAPPLLLLGAPTTPLLRGLSKLLRKNLIAPLMRNLNIRALYRFLTFAGTTWLLFTINMWAWHFYGDAYELATQTPTLHILMHWTFIGTASLFWWIVIDPRPLRSKIPYPLRVFFLGVTMFQNVALGAGITFKSTILYPYYESRPRLWEITAFSDQQAGGLVMWIIGTMMFVGALIVVLAVWLDKEEKRTRSQEAKAAVAGPKVPEHESYRSGARLN